MQKQSGLDKLLLKEKTIVVFWATWCDPCIDELQNFKPIMNTILEKGYGLVFINYDGKENLKKTEAFLKTLDPMIAAQNYFDFNGSVLGDLGISSLPTSLIVDKSGKIQRVISGPLEAKLL